MTLEEMENAGVLVRQADGSLLLQLHVQPNAKRTELVGQHGDRLKLRLAAPPVDGKANERLVRWAATYFEVRRTAVTLVRGQSSRQKTLRIQPG